MPANQIKQREKKDPNDIDEMPIQSNHFDWRIIAGVVASFPGLGNQVNEQPRANHHVKRVHAGHTKIERKENANLVCKGSFEGKAGAGQQIVVYLVSIFKSFYHKKGGAED